MVAIALGLGSELCFLFQHQEKPAVLVSSNWCSRSHSSLEDPPLALFNRVITA